VGCGKARNKQLRTDLVDEAVWEEVCRLLSHPERLEQEYRRRLVQEEKMPDELSSLEARMGRLRQGIARLIDSYADGLIDKGEFEPRMARMRERLKQIEAQAQQVTDEASLERELTLILGRLDEFAARVKTGLHEADWLSRREIIRALVKRVEIDQEQVRVVFRVNPPPQAPVSPSEKDAQSLQHCRRRAQPNTGKCLFERVGPGHYNQDGDVQQGQSEKGKQGVSVDQQKGRCSQETSSTDRRVDGLQSPSQDQTSDPIQWPARPRVSATLLHKICR
jgi:site-specific DNA recombinase